MQRVLSLVRKCVAEYKMIENGDIIGVGVSGGKDSLIVLLALNELRRFYPRDYQIKAITIDSDPGKSDYSPIRKLCEDNGIEYSVVPSNIFEIIFDIRKETNPCSLCAKMRRGMLHDEALRLGCNKIALGHNFNDAVETFLMSQIFEGRISCFSPVTHMDRKGLYQIRPLLYADERLIRGVTKRLELPVVKNPCPANGNTKREEIKNFVAEMNKKYPGYSTKIFNSMQRLPLPGWEKLDSDPRRTAREAKNEAD